MLLILFAQLIIIVWQQPQHCAVVVNFGYYQFHKTEYSAIFDPFAHDDNHDTLTFQWLILSIIKHIPCSKTQNVN